MLDETQKWADDATDCLTRLLMTVRSRDSWCPIALGRMFLTTRSWVVPLVRSVTANHSVSRITFAIRFAPPARRPLLSLSASLRAWQRPTQSSTHQAVANCRRPFADWLAGLGVPIVTRRELATNSWRSRSAAARGSSHSTPAARPAADPRRAAATQGRLVHRRRACVVVDVRGRRGVRRRHSTRGADEVMREGMAAAEATTRLDAMLRRSDRDLVVHPSTRLPGAVEIEAEITRRLSEGKLFATCYADLDHFKEFNDRYSYHEGDRVIRILAQDSARRREGLMLGRGIRRAHRRRRLHLHHPGRQRERGVLRDRRGLRHADSVSVLRAGSPRWLFFREGSPRTAASSAIDDGVDRRGDERAATFHARGAGERTCNRNEELREDASRLGVLDRSATGCDAGTSQPISRAPRQDDARRRASERLLSGVPLGLSRRSGEGAGDDVRARCSVCGGVITVSAGSSIEDEFSSNSLRDRTQFDERIDASSGDAVACSARQCRLLAAALLDTLRAARRVPQRPTPAPSAMPAVSPSRTAPPRPPARREAGRCRNAMIAPPATGADGRAANCAAGRCCFRLVR